MRLPDVLRDMRRAQEEMNRLFGGLRFALRSEFPAVNVWASAEGVIVTAQVPGVSPDQLDVTVHQDTVTLRGKREAETFEGEVVWHRQERPHGPFSAHASCCPSGSMPTGSRPASSAACSPSSCPGPRATSRGTSRSPTPERGGHQP